MRKIRNKKKGYTLYNGECIEIMKRLKDNSVHSIITDPPYNLFFMGKEWDNIGSSKEFQKWVKNWAKEAIRVLKPGGHLLSFCGTRQYHRMVCGIEDAGFEIRDTVAWVYGSGFPKSLDISKQIDKIKGKKGKVIGKYKTPEGNQELTTYNNFRDKSKNKQERRSPDIIEPSSIKAKQYKGFGTALKPGMELIVVARKPISEGNVAKNVLKHGTGGLNIDECRVPTKDNLDCKVNGDEKSKAGNGKTFGKMKRVAYNPSDLGRWPANFIHDGGEEVLEYFPSSKQNNSGPYLYKDKNYNVKGFIENIKPNSPSNFGDGGSAARFFYCAKVSKKERNDGLDNFKLEKSKGKFNKGNGTGERFDGNKIAEYKNNHPTVKPIDLMKYLVRLITPKKGKVLDPFLGSGSTGVAALIENFKFIGIELDKDYFKIAKERIKNTKLIKLPKSII